jgi:hypothetical protein
MTRRPRWRWQDFAYPVIIFVIIAAFAIGFAVWSDWMWPSVQ